MRDIYLIDFENVASEGLSGITYLAPEDEVIIFYSNNSNRLSMKMHILIGKSVCKCNYYEVTVGGKNALDHQISTWLGYLIGTKAADRNYYIVSKDMGYKFVASFWTESTMHPSVRCIDNIRAASRLGSRRAKEEPELPAEPETAPEIPAEASAPEPIPESLAAEPMPESVIPAALEPEMPETPEPAPEPVPEPVPETPAEPESVKKTPAKRTFFGVVLPDWPEKTPEAPAEAPAPETPTAEPAPEVPAEPESEQHPEPETASRADRTGVWPPLEDTPDESDAPSRSRSRSRSRRSRSRSRGAQKEAEESVEGKPAPQPEPEKKPETRTSRRASSKSEKAPAAKREPEKKPETKGRSEKKQESKKPESKKPEIGSLIAPFPGLQEPHLQQLIAENKKQVLCNTLRKQLGQEKGLALYNEIKKLAWK